MQYAIDHENTNVILPSQIKPGKDIERKKHHHPQHPIIEIKEEKRKSVLFLTGLL
jgi:hypothetical protein